jgi:hypothetical protein
VTGEGDKDGGDEGAPKSIISRRRYRDDLAVYREDDNTFKNRLKESVINHQLLNTIATLVLFVVIFYVLTDNYFIGLVAGLLVLTVSNMTNAVWRIRDFERWEIFSNGVKLGYNPGGQLKFVRFADIRTIEVRKGLRGQVVVMDLGNRRLRFPYDQNKDVFDLLRHKYASFQEIQKSPGGQG